MGMSEEVRQFYLNAAGVRMWYAKKPLPGAAPSPEFSFPSEPDTLSEGGPLEPVPRPSVTPPDRRSATKVVKDSPSRTVDLQSLMASGSTSQSDTSPPEAELIETSLPETTVAPSDTRPPVPAEAAVAPSPATVVARLALWVSKDYLLIGQWSDEASDRLQDTLAQNILKAMGAVTTAERQEIHWPVFRNPKIPGNGIEDFRRVLSSVLSAAPGRKIVMLGVLGEQEPELRELCLGACLSEAVIDFPQSLAELSGSSSHKRSLWQAIQKQAR